MEFRRYALLIVFFVATFVLWDLWEREHHHYPGAQKATPSEVAEHPSMPVKVENKEATDDLENFKPISSDRLISVKTNLFELSIDKRGGNIVDLRLTQYKQADKKQPFILFNNKPETLYIAQSGLVSNEGPDRFPKGQATYQSAQSTFEMKPDQDSLNVILTWKNPATGLKVNKVFIFKRDRYVISLDYEIENKGQKTWQGYSFSELKRKDKVTSQDSFHTFFGAAVSSDEKPFNKITFKSIAKKPLSQDISNGWAAMIQHYFLSAWIPEKNKVYHYYTRQLKDDVYAVGVISPTLIVPPTGKLTVNSELYSGPAEADRLEATAPHLNLAVDYGMFWFIAVALFWVMKKLYVLFGNWGWAIIGVTVIIKIAFYRLSATSYRSMARMRDVQPKLQALKERFGDDRQAMTKATMEFYKKEKINPLGGCLPILIQIPVFLGLYWVLIESVELRHASFILWFHDLSAKDPFYVLPLLMGLSMLVQQKMSPPPPDPTQAKMMMLMPIVFTAFFLNGPSGLVLYWLVNNVLSILQQWWINRQTIK